MRAARAAKSRPGAGKELGEKPGSSARPRVNVPSDPILPLDQDGNGLGNGHLKNFHYSLIRVLRAIHRRAKRCLRKGKKGVRKPDGQQQSAAVSRSRWRAEHRAAAQGRAAPRPGRCAGGGTPHGSPQWGLSAPPRAAHERPRGTPSRTAARLRTAARRAERSRPPRGGAEAGPSPPGPRSAVISCGAPPQGPLRAPLTRSGVPEVPARLLAAAAGLCVGRPRTMEAVKLET